jgi:DNA-binding transcriptional regulator YiaG
MAVTAEHKAKRHVQARTKPKVRPGGGTSVKPAMVLELRKRLHLSQAVFARLLPISVRSLATLETGAPATEVVARRLKELLRLRNALSEVMKKESLGPWLETPNGAFDGLKPLEVIERGESDRIWSMIFFLRSGAPS